MRNISTLNQCSFELFFMLSSDHDKCKCFFNTTSYRTCQFSNLQFHLFSFFIQKHYSCYPDSRQPITSPVLCAGKIKSDSIWLEKEIQRLTKGFPQAINTESNSRCWQPLPIYPCTLPSAESFESVRIDTKNLENMGEKTRYSLFHLYSSYKKHRVSDIGLVKVIIKTQSN